MTEKIIDLSTFKALQESAGADFVKELVDTFLEDAPNMLDDLRRALAAGDADRFRRAAHSLKSNSNTFGAVSLGAIARDLEVNGLERARGNADPLGHLLQEYSRVAETLRELRDA